MNRSVERRQMAVSAVPRGEVAVASWFAHPHRGQVRCLAAPVVAASLRESGLRVREVEASTGAEAGGSVLFTTSYLDRDGGAVGFGAAARVDDPTALSAAYEVVETWSECLRTRRALVAVTGSDRAEGARGRLLGMARCRAREFAARGDTVVQVGPAELGLAGTVAVTTVADVAGLADVDPERVSFVVTPGMPVEESAVVLAELRSRFPRLRGQHPDEWCYAASDRKEALRSVSTACDLLLVCGQQQAADTRQLIAWADPVCGPRQIADVGQLRPEWLAPAATVGIAAASSARHGLVDEVLTVLSGLGPLSVAYRSVTTEVATPWAPARVGPRRAG